MVKKILLAVIAILASMNLAFAQVDVNKADQAALDSVKGVGPATSKAILEERKKNGNFKDWADFQSRVKGIGDKSSEKLSDAGLTVNGQSKPKAAAKAATSPSTGQANAGAKTDGKADAKADAKAADAKAADTKAADTKAAPAKSASGKDMKKDEARK